MKASSLLPLCLLLIALVGCGQAERERREAAKKNLEQIGKSLEEYHAKQQQATASLAVFQERILPIFQSAKPSSCSECHLSGVDLKEYIRPTQQQTFVSLVGAGMIDTENPDESKILRFINRSPENPNLVTEKVRKQEYDAFRAWIRAAAADPQLLAAKGDAAPIGPQVPEEVVRHARRDRVLASFIDNIWTEVGRCAACHSPDRNQQQVNEHGDQVSWITLSDPQATLDYMIGNDLIDAENPEQSLLLTKPTLQLEHGGGQKMVVGDRSYKQFRRFIDDYAAMVQGKYTETDRLPNQSSEVSVVTDIWLKIEGVPTKYDKMLLQADLYRHTDSGWSEFRVATSDRPVFGKGNLWQHSLSLTAPRGSARASEIESQRLPAGRYLVKLSIDQTGKLQQDFTAELGEDEFVGQVEVESEWPAGYGRMTVVKFPEN
jgi:mono/diheme cytochrome c family protein